MALSVSASLNKTSYNPGETAVLTVNYSDPVESGSTSTLTVTGVDEAGQQGTATLVLTKSGGTPHTVTLAVVDSSGRVWTKTADTGSVATFTATV